MSHSTFTILLAGKLTVTDRLRHAVKGSRSIAADSGMRHAEALQLVPELWVGDFDSTDPALERAWPQVERKSYPPAKAVTDGEIATSEALGRGARKLVLVGALGGERSDHALQHILHAISLAENGIDVMLTSGEEEAYPLLNDPIERDLPPGSLFSVLGFSPLDGLDIVGARYPLTDFTLPFGSSRTVSNVAQGPVRFHLRRGKAMILARPHDLSGA